MARMFLLLLLTLASCGPSYKITKDYINPQNFEGRNCVNSCINNRTTCRNHCKIASLACESLDEIKAIGEYKYYKKGNKEAEEWRSTEKTLSDFRTPCNQDCNDHCINDYDDCFVNCGGRIDFYKVCTAFCN